MFMVNLDLHPPSLRTPPPLSESWLNIIWLQIIYCWKINPARDGLSFLIMHPFTKEYTSDGKDQNGLSCGVNLEINRSDGHQNGIMAKQNTSQLECDQGSQKMVTMATNIM